MNFLLPSSTKISICMFKFIKQTNMNFVKAQWTESVEAVDNLVSTFTLDDNRVRIRFVSMWYHPLSFNHHPHPSPSDLETALAPRNECTTDRAADWRLGEMNETNESPLHARTRLSEPDRSRYSPTQSSIYL